MAVHKFAPNFSLRRSEVAAIITRKLGNRMQLRFWLRLAIVLPIIVGSFSAQAYGPEGHRAVGAIADKLIQGTEAGAQVNKILQGMSLETVAVWADCVKGVSQKPDGTFVYQSDDSKYPECKPFDSDVWKRRNESYVSRNWKQCGSAHGFEYCHNQYHYADISIRRDHYDPSYVGANNHDIVHAINAAIAKLRGDPVPAPFDIVDKQEALMMLTHYLGDLHQPLHVAAIYLDGQGRIVDPDVTGYQAANDTNGGNNVFDGSSRFHFEWDEIPSDLTVGGAKAGEMLAIAKTVAPATGDALSWSTQWATDTIVNGKTAFDRLRFSVDPYAKHAPEWTVWDQDDLYRSDAAALKKIELAKGGARLAQVLMTIWPGAKPVGDLSSSNRSETSQ